MINHISIRNFAVIEHTEVDFEEGLNIVTGETGSGKSVLIEAISLALGSRADTSSIRTGCDKAVIQLQGELNGEELVITREISSSGKNLCKLNGEIVTLAQLNSISKRMADIHGQYDNQSLLNPDSHISLLDAYHTEETFPLRQEVSVSYSAFSAIRDSLNRLISSEKENARKKDFFQFEKNEIDRADLKPGEDAELESHIALLQNSEKIYESLEKTYSTIYEQTPSAIDGIGTGVRALEAVSKYSSEMSDLSQNFSDIYYKLQDLGHELRNIKDTITFSPVELDAAIARLETIQTLKKKYGDTIEEIQNYRDKISGKLDVIDNFDQEKENLQKQLFQEKTRLLKACEALTKKRKSIAAELSEKIESELVDLNFNDAEVEIQVTPLPSPSENGMDKVEILIATNRGEPLKPLVKVASGGEMSRIMLAFKNILSSCDHIPTLIFDEIDNGISGITASIVGKKLKEIAVDHQIICITHLPQIAACGKNNYRIFKEIHDEKTFTSVEKLSNAEKVQEIARLLGGTTITETTLHSAQELIENS